MAIDGKNISLQIYKDIQSKHLSNLKLAIILANDDESSKKYTDLKKSYGEKLGISVEIFRFDKNSTKDKIINLISQLNADDSFNGIVVQLPLFKHLEDDTFEILNNIDYRKDADGLTTTSLASAFNYNENSIMPAAVEAVLIALSQAKDPNDLNGQSILIINNSNLVGNPLAIVLSRFNATVTIANEFTKNLKDLTLNSDIIVSATGVTNIIEAKDIKMGAILIDVTSVSLNGMVLGDFVYDQDLINKCSAYTKVPGGIGPITVASLFKNLVRLKEIYG